MTLAVAGFVTDGEILGMAVAAFAQGLDMLQSRRVRRNMLAAYPARHDAMKLPRNGSVHLDAKVAQTAHTGIFLQNL